MAFAPNVWSQLKGKSADDIVDALGKDGWVLDPESSGAIRVYLKGEGQSRRRITIHYHPRKTYGPNLLKALLADIGWDEKDMKRIKFIK